MKIKYILAIVASLVVLLGLLAVTLYASSQSANPAAAGTVMPTIPVAITPTPTFPPLGEWEDILPYSFSNDDYALVIDIQQVNSTTDVASIISIVGECQWTMNGEQSDPYVLAASASDQITGSDITISANVAYWNDGIRTIYDMQFAGTIDTSGNLLLASSELGGVQDYTFIPTTDAVSSIRTSFQQDTCS